MRKKQTQTTELQAVEIPSVKEYLTAVQRDGTELCAKDVYRRTAQWIKEQHCENVISEQMISKYCMVVLYENQALFLLK